MSTQNTSSFRTIFAYLPFLLIVFGAAASVLSYNKIQSNDESVTSAFSELLNQYQRRYELVPNLVSTVKGYAGHEKELLTEVAQARAQVGKIKMSAGKLDDEAAMASFQKAQGELDSSLSRLIVVSENYPDLKTNRLFGNLMTQLEGTDNKIAVARGRYVKAVQIYNTQLRQFPGVIFANYFNYKVKPNYSLNNDAVVTAAPIVSFNSTSAN